MYLNPNDKRRHSTKIRLSEIEQQKLQEYATENHLQLAVAAREILNDALELIGLMKKIEGTKKCQSRKALQVIQKLQSAQNTKPESETLLDSEGFLFRRQSRRYLKSA